VTTAVYCYDFNQKTKQKLYDNPNQTKITDVDLFDGELYMVEAEIVDLSLQDGIIKVSKKTIFKYHAGQRTVIHEYYAYDELEDNALTMHNGNLYFLTSELSSSKELISTAKISDFQTTVYLSLYEYQQNNLKALETTRTYSNEYSILFRSLSINNKQLNYMMEYNGLLELRTYEEGSYKFTELDLPIQFTSVRLTSVGKLGGLVRLNSNSPSKHYFLDNNKLDYFVTPILFFADQSINGRQFGYVCFDPEGKQCKVAYLELLDHQLEIHQFNDFYVTNSGDFFPLNDHQIIYSNKTQQAILNIK